MVYLINVTLNATLDLVYCLFSWKTVPDLVACRIMSDQGPNSELSRNYTSVISFINIC